MILNICVEMPMLKNSRVGERLPAVDALRGLAIVLMFVDHARLFFVILPFHPMDPDFTNFYDFFLRWLTYAAAPIFLFLAGVSAYFRRERRHCTAGQLSFWLLTRGIYLIILEITALHFLWTFRADWQPLTLQVFFALGVSMIALSLLSYLPPLAIFIIGAATIATHNLADGISQERGGSFLWTLLHVYGSIRVGPDITLRVVYPVLPWAGILFLGYGASTMLYSGAVLRRRALLVASISLMAGFILLRMLDRLEWHRGSGVLNVLSFPVVFGFGNHYHWHPRNDTVRTMFDFLNVCKYPPSLVFTLMSLSAAGLFLVGIDWLVEKGRDVEKNRSAFSRLSVGVSEVLSVFGSVPLFAYCFHLLILHLAAMIFLYFQNGLWLNDLLAYPSAARGVSSFAVPIIAGATVFISYLFCRWYARFRSNLPANWRGFF